jgi:hypothetical protein
LNISLYLDAVLVEAMMPEKYTQWSLIGQDGIESLKCGQAEMPKDLGEHDVLVKIHAASLNYRDLVLAKVNGLLTERCILVYMHVN